MAVRDPEQIEAGDMGREPRQQVALLAQRQRQAERADRQPEPDLGALARPPRRDQQPHAADQRQHPDVDVGLPVVIEPGHQQLAEVAALERAAEHVAEAAVGARRRRHRVARRQPRRRQQRRGQRPSAISPAP
ncbi:MAG: hypothetical protein H6709_07385 [Kofleriaceae bacterium]|nr:hypothetical protein [Kofleriaceae bacterium]